MSATVKSPFLRFGLGGDYLVELNYGVRIYTNPPQNEIIPNIGEESASLKGGQRTNFFGEVPLLDGDKKQIGWVEITKIVSAKPEHMPEEEIQLCGFKNMNEAVNYVKKEHGEEFDRDGVLTVFHFKVKKLNNV